ncbi:MAG: hypothetical protein PWP08_1011 [Methanofollis sp.]|nr:hypothetical protein [Methanofollis sp.]
MERVTSSPAFSMIMWLPVCLDVVKPNLWKVLTAVEPDMTGSFAMVCYTDTSMTLLPTALCARSLRTATQPGDGVPDIFQRLFDGLSFRVAAGKCRAADGEPAVFVVGRDDDFEDHDMMIFIIAVSDNGLEVPVREMYARTRGDDGDPGRVPETCPSLQASQSGRSACPVTLRRPPPATTRALDHREFSRVSTDPGCCTICGWGRAVFLSVDGRVVLCEGCYARLVRAWCGRKGIALTPLDPLQTPAAVPGMAGVGFCAPG